MQIQSGQTVLVPLIQHYFICGILSSTVSVDTGIRHDRQSWQFLELYLIHCRAFLCDSYQSKGTPSFLLKPLQNAKSEFVSLYVLSKRDGITITCHISVTSNWNDFKKWTEQYWHMPTIHCTVNNIFMDTGLLYMYNVLLHYMTKQTQFLWYQKQSVLSCLGL